MASISNPSLWPLRLPTGHIVPAKGELQTVNDIIRSVDNWPTLNGLALSGQITLSFDPDPDPLEDVAAAASPTPEPALILSAPAMPAASSEPVDMPTDAATATDK